MQTLDTEHNHSNIRGRFAPSPSGRLHLGNLLSSLLAWLDVRALGGTMVFRLEDLDPERSYPEYANLMAEDLLWMGLDWDEGWTPNRNPEYTQGCRSTLYEEVFAQFQSQGQIYPCYCSRAQRLAASAPHPGEQQELGCHCRFLTEEEKLVFAKNHRKPAYKIRMDNCNIDFIDGHYGPQHFLWLLDKMTLLSAAQTACSHISWQFPTMMPLWVSPAWCAPETCSAPHPDKFGSFKRWVESFRNIAMRRFWLRLTGGNCPNETGI